MEKKTLRDIALEGQKILVRVDYNVPMENGVITDDTRITATLPTVHYLLEAGAAVILMAHLGRPKGKPDPAYTLKPVAAHLSKLLGRPVRLVPDCVGDEAEKAADGLVSGDLLLLENLRFHKEEEENDSAFAAKLAGLADIYVNDGFGVSHRAHASVEGVTHYLPSVAGFLLEKEIRFVGQAVERPQRPFAAIIGGAKVSDKIGVIDNLLGKVDSLIIGGGMANTFLAAQGCDMGKSLVEEDKIELAKQLVAKAKEKGVKLFLPLDFVAAEKFAADARREVCAADKIKSGWMALDIGEKTRKLYAGALSDAKMIVWNGPMGVFEMDAFAGGTEAVAKAVAASGAVSIVGGGDSVAAIEKLKLADKITHISTGGGASLEYLEGKALPGIEALDDLRLVMIAGNWKMHKTIDQALSLATEIVDATSGAKPEVVIFPPFTALESVAAAIDGKHVGYGGQDLHWEDQGAYTGAISGSMLADIGCQYVLAGHSERRHIFGETDDVVSKKVQAAIRNGLAPVVCVGETDAERRGGRTEEVVSRQVRSALADVAESDLLTFVIAYEPVWAIGTGNTASPADADNVCGYIRRLLEEISPNGSRFVRVLYGGSVNSKNIKDIMAADNIDGVLVGGASLNAQEFSSIARY